MKYLVHRGSKEHIRYHEDSSLPLGGWYIVEADPEGWIKHDGDFNPLPDDCGCEIELRDGSFDSVESHYLDWRRGGAYSIVKYRPILDDKPDAVADTPYPVGDPRGWQEVGSADLIDRLKSAHKAANDLPDIIAELREVLEPMGLTVCHTSPFYEEDAEPEPDMADWRNWREGDEVVVTSNDLGLNYPPGALLTIGTDRWGDFGVKSVTGNIYARGCFSEFAFNPDNFRFHSRPTKEQGK